MNKNLAFIHSCIHSFLHSFINLLIQAFKMWLTKVKSTYDISLADAKAHLRVDTSTEDAYITNLIAAAFIAAEQYINKDIVYTDNTLILQNFLGWKCEIDEGNMLSITSVKDESNNTLAWGDLQIYDSWFMFYLNSQIPIQTLTVNFKTGYAVGTLDPLIKQAILIKIADLFENDRSSSNFNTIQNNKVFENILNPYVAKKVKYINYNTDIHRIM